MCICGCMACMCVCAHSAAMLVVFSERGDNHVTIQGPRLPLCSCRVPPNSQWLLGNKFH